MNSKIGNIYTFCFEETMLKIANQLEDEGYKVKRDAYKFSEITTWYRVEIIGYR